MSEASPYSGVTCQDDCWKGHTKKCATPKEVHEKVMAASIADDWREVLKWEGGMNEITVSLPDDAYDDIRAVQGYLAHKKHPPL